MTRTSATLLAGVLLLAACGSSSDTDLSAGTDAQDSEGGGPTAAAACAPGHPDCDDTIVVPDEGGLPMDDAADGGDNPDSPVTDDEDVPGRHVGAPRLVEPTGDARNVRLVNWDDFIETDDPLTYRVAFWGGVEPCHVVDRVEVTETADRVIVALYVGSAPGSQDVACIELAEYQAVEFTLDAPLGERIETDAFEADEIE